MPGLRAAASSSGLEFRGLELSGHPPPPPHASGTGTHGPGTAPTAAPRHPRAQCAYSSPLRHTRPACSLASSSLHCKGVFARKNGSPRHSSALGRFDGLRCKHRSSRLLSSALRTPNGHRLAAIETTGRYSRRTRSVLAATGIAGLSSHLIVAGMSGMESPLAM
jgi:hypothetical protein